MRIQISRANENNHDIANFDWSKMWSDENFKDERVIALQSFKQKLSNIVQ